MLFIRKYRIGLCVFILLQFACNPYSNILNKKQNVDNHKILPKKKSLHKPSFLNYIIVNNFPHDTDSYTQGLQFDNGFLYESTGLYGKSTLRKVNLSDGKSSLFYQLPDSIFGEGLVVIGDRIFQLTWQQQLAFIYKKETFEKIKEFKYSYKEGWGLTYDGKYLIMSDGSPILHFLNKDSFLTVRDLVVYDNRGPVENLNELEYINGEIWANIYLSNYIIVISPATGEVVAKIDMTGILSSKDKRKNTNVINGIAYDPDTKRLFVTGKNWPKLFEIKIVEKREVK
jgi:glutaminyl-peptide cyclotransferase